MPASSPRRRAACWPRSCARPWRTGSRSGPEAALTGPVARGDDHTVSAQRQAISAASPQLLPLFDALVERTRAIAA